MVSNLSVFFGIPFRKMDLIRYTFKVCIYLDDTPIFSVLPAVMPLV